MYYLDLDNADCSKTAEPFDTVFFDTDTILILPRSENSILILY